MRWPRSQSARTRAGRQTKSLKAARTDPRRHGHVELRERKRLGRPAQGGQADATTQDSTAALTIDPHADGPPDQESKGGPGRITDATLTSSYGNGSD